MDFSLEYINFLKRKSELIMLARNSVLFCALPDDLRDFEVEVEKLKQNPGSEKLISYFVDLFTEEKRRVDAMVSIIREARAKMAE